MIHDPDSVSLKLSNAARMVLNAVATETGPLTDCELFLAGCDVVKVLSAIPNTLEVGDKVINVPRALDDVSGRPSDDPQRIGIEQLAEKWQARELEITLPRQLAAVLVMQLDFILRAQSKNARINLPLTQVCAELVRELDRVR